MKIKVYFFLAIFVSCLSVCVQSFAQDSLIIGKDVKAKKGEDVEVFINIQSNPGISAARVAIKYDINSMTLISAHNGDVFDETTFTAGNLKAVPYLASWISLKNFGNDGVLIRLKFSISSQAKAGNYPIEISYNENDIFNIDEQNVAFQVTNANVVVENSTKLSSESNPKSSSTSTTKPAVKITFDNFKKINDYKSKLFSDVKEIDWFYKSVVTAYELDIVKGKSEGVFDPSSGITVAEAITLATRVRTIYFGENIPDMQSGINWYDKYVKYAIDNKIMNADSFDDYTRNILRKEMAFLFANALPQECYEKINHITEIPDVKIYNKYYKEIISLYTAGILTGSDKYGTFYPESEIRRSEATAIINRVSICTNRITR